MAASATSSCCGELRAAGVAVPTPHPTSADRVTLLRPVGPQRVFNLLQDWEKVNVSSGCAPTPPPQTPAQAPRGLGAPAAQKVGHPEAGVLAGVGGGEVGQKAVPTQSCFPSDPPRLADAAASPPRTLPAHHPGLSGPSETPTSLGAPCPVTWSLPTSRHPLGTGKAGPGGEGAEGPPRLTTLLDFQVPPLDAGPPSHPAWTPAACCPPPGQQPFPGSPPEARTLCRSDRGPRAPAPCPEPPACTGRPVAHGEELRRGHGLGPGNSHSDVPPPAPRCLCDGKRLGSSW